MACLSQASGYAILAMGFIASAAGKPLLVRTIADRCDLPAPYLAKVVNRLARAGLVHTQRGVNGGVTLAADPRDISLLAVCKALDDPVLQPRCMLGVAVCSDERACPAHELHTAQRRRLLEFLSGTSLADIASFETQRRWGGTAAAALKDLDATLTVSAPAGINGHTRESGSGTA